MSSGCDVNAVSTSLGLSLNGYCTTAPPEVATPTPTHYEDRIPTAKQRRKPPRKICYVRQQPRPLRGRHAVYLQARTATQKGSAKVSNPCSLSSGPGNARFDTHFVQVLVCNERESELWTASNDTSGATFEERLEAFFPICTVASYLTCKYGCKSTGVTGDMISQ